MSDKNKVLRQRSITGLIFGGVVIGSIVLGRYTFMFLLAVLMIVGAAEYTQMVYPESRLHRMTAMVLTGLTGIFITYICPPFGLEYLTVLFTCCALLLLGIVNLKIPFIDHLRWWPLVSMVYLGMTCGLMSSYAYHAIPYPKTLIFAIIGSIWINDTMAYLIGSRVGKRKFWPRISPNKTWEGFIGGGSLTILVGWIVGRFTSEYSPSFWLGLAFIAWIIGTLGDLVESSIKRAFGVKDSGNMLPGHGGVLDRFDSLLYITPFVLLLLYILG
jgi:phosphatidate cytidylyltransferase